MTRSRTLLFLVNVDWFFSSHRLSVGRAALRAGWRVHIATAITHLRPELEAEGFIVHDVSLKRGSNNPIYIAVYFVRVFLLLRRIRPDVLHTVTIVPVLFGGLAAQLAKVPFVVASISGLGYLFSSPRANLRRKLVGLVYKGAVRRKQDIVIFQNLDDCAELRRIAYLRREQVVLIPGMGVDIGKFHPSNGTSQASVVVLFAARLLNDKGIREFVEAARLLETREDVEFTVVGCPDPGNPESVSGMTLRQFQSSASISWRGFREDMALEYSNADIYVLPSYREGFPKTIMEASASGLPTITTDVPGCRDAVVHGVTGFVVPKRRASALGVAIETLLDEPELRSEMGLNAREHAVANFDQDVIASRHVDIYESLWCKLSDR